MSPNAICCAFFLFVNFLSNGIDFFRQFGYSHKQIVDFAKTLPGELDPGILGFPPNAAITKNINESNAFLNTLLLTQVQGGEGEGKT